jgi:Holliday junction resolvase RusA-like endonuclease
VKPLVLTVFGIPVAQGRPKFFRRGDHVGAYDPKKSRDYKSSIRIQAIEKLRVNGSMPPLYEGALAMQVHAYLPRPKTLPKRIVHHVKRPDGENISKGICDALQGVAFKDDAQIVELIIRKSYGDPPRVIIGIREA